MSILAGILATMGSIKTIILTWSLGVNIPTIGANKDLTDVAYGNGLWVAVNSGVANSIITTSTNGINWSEVTVPVSKFWGSVLYAGGKWVILEGPANATQGVLYSTNGVNWTYNATGFNQVQKWTYLAYGNGKWVALTAGDGAGKGWRAYSTNGINWTVGASLTDLSIIDPVLSNLIFDGTRFLAAYAAMYTYASTNGVNWGVISPSFNSLNMTSGPGGLAYGNGVYVMTPISTNTIAVYSTNAVNWQSTPIPSAAPRKSLVFAFGLFIAPSDNLNSYLCSTNGVNWIETSFSIGNTVVYNKIAYSPETNTAVCVSPASNIANVSFNGVDWIAASVSNNIASSSWGKIIRKGNFTFAFPTTATYSFSISTDNINWTVKAAPSAILTDVEYNGVDKYVIIAQSKIALYSTDGVVWYQASMAGTTGNIGSISYKNGKFVVLGSALNAATTTVFYSSDGIQWYCSNPSASVFTGIEFDGIATYVAIYNGGCAVSKDGKSWTKIAITGLVSTAIKYKNGLWVIVGSGATSAYSTDGFTWTKTSLPGASASTLNYVGGYWVATITNSNGQYTSTNGINWSGNLISSGVYTSVAYDGIGTYVAISSSAVSTIYSKDGLYWNTGASVAGTLAVAYGNGIWVSISSTGACYTSTNGINWINTGTIPAVVSFVSLTYGANGFIAMEATGDFSKSTNGVVWSSNRMPSVSTWNSLTYNGVDTFLATSIYSGTAAPMAVSKDGVTWSAITNSYPAGTISDVAYGNGKWIVMYSGVTRVSTDLVNWVTPTIPGSTAYSICYGNGMWLGTTNTKALVTSTDAINWSTTALVLPLASYAVGSIIRYHPTGGWVVLHQSTDAVSWSSNGTTWSNTTLPSYCYPGLWGNLKYERGRWYAANSTNTINSTNGVTWRPCQNGTTSRTGLTLTSVMNANGKIVLYTNTSNNMLTSTDGVIWSELWGLPTLALFQGINSIAYGNGLWAAIVKDGNIGTTSLMTRSTNGINWTPTYSLPSVQTWYDIAYGNGKWIAAYSSGMVYSTDAINWVSCPGTIGAQKLLYANNVWIGYGSGIASSYSTNGVNWVANPGLSTGTPQLAYGNGLWVAGYIQGTSPKYSTNGINWLTAAGVGMGQNLGYLVFGNGIFAHMGSNATECKYSTNGINWSTATISGVAASSNYLGMVHDGNKFLLVGCTGGTTGNSAVVSLDGKTWGDVRTTLYSGTYKWVASSLTKTLCLTEGSNIVRETDDFGVWTNLGCIEYMSTQSAAVKGLAYGNGVYVATLSNSYCLAYSTLP